MTGGQPPAGYVRVHAARWRCAVTTLESHADDALAMLAVGPLHDAASRMPSARPLEGRGVAYAVRLPHSGLAAVVRHNHHGGLFAPITRDLFLAPTRAPYELLMSLKLAERGVRTPTVLMYGVQRAAGPWRRADVMTREVEGAMDLAAFMQPGSAAAARAQAWAAARELLEELDVAGVRHHDLNVKNVLLSPKGDALEAWLLDVDRVELGARNAQWAWANHARLLRSARKWRDERGALFDEHELSF